MAEPKTPAPSFLGFGRGVASHAPLTYRLRWRFWHIVNYVRLWLAHPYIDLDEFAHDFASDADEHEAILYLSQHDIRKAFAGVEAWAKVRGDE